MYPVVFPATSNLIKRCASTFFVNLNKRITPVKWVHKIEVNNRVSSCLYSTLTPNEFLGTEYIGDLKLRFLKHIAIVNSKVQGDLIPEKKTVQKIIKYSDFYPIHDLNTFVRSANKVPVDQIFRLIVFTTVYKPNGDIYKFARILNEIDSICVRHLQEMDTNTILNILNAFAFLIPTKITRLEFYEHAMKKLVQNDQEDKEMCSLSARGRELFIQKCFYLGLWKKNSFSTPLMKELIDISLNKYLNDLTQLEFAIVMNSLYRISLPILDAEHPANRRLEKEILSMNLENSDLTVTFVKSLRLNRVKSQNINDHLKMKLFSEGNKEINSYDFKGIAHIFAYFANSLWNDVDVMKFAVKECMRKLYIKCGKSERVFNDMRTKDIANLLWSCSHLKAKDLLLQKDYEFLERLIFNKITEQEYRYCPDELIDSLLSLWMLGRQSEVLFSELRKFFPNSPYSIDKKRHERIKLDSRHKLLWNCVQIEKPDWIPKTCNSDRTLSDIFNPKRKAENYLLKRVENLNRFVNCLERNKDVLNNIKSFSVVTAIDEINLPSLLVQVENGNLDGKTTDFFIEVIEDNQLLHFNNEPIALIDLKIRLLENLGQKVITILPHQLNEEEDLLQLLKKKFEVEDHDKNEKEKLLIW